MNTQRILRNVTLALTLLSMANVGVLAKDSRTVSVMIPATLNGVKLAKGKYKVSWESNSPRVTLKFTRGRKTIVTAQGRFVDRDVKYRHNMVVYRTNTDGTHSIMEIRFKGKSRVIVLDE